MKNNQKNERAQREKCKEFGAEFIPAPENLKVGIALNVKDGMLPLNGLRHQPENGTTGWYIWAGEEFSMEPEFFKPLHLTHLHEWCPEIVSFLGLAPGWRFLLAGDYQDVWYDESMLEAD